MSEITCIGHEPDRGSEAYNAATLTSLSHSDYTVGWICALPLEFAAAKAMLDSIHPALHNPGRDQNTYTLGKVGLHNVVIACMSSGVYGMTSATRAISQMGSSFPSIRFSLMVGIGGGAPSTDADVRLGDVVVSHPTANFGGVVQYDYGKTIQAGAFHRVGVLNKPPEVLLTAISSLRADHRMRLNHIAGHLSSMAAEYPTMASDFTHPPQQPDHLFEAEYEHIELENTCERCDLKRLVKRPPRPGNCPVVHYGLIASANQVMKHAATRDKLARELGVLCFEMEAGGLMDVFPSLVIRGISDYADSHKNKQWQAYAAATAAAYAKELLSTVPVNQNRLSNMERGPIETVIERWNDAVKISTTHCSAPFVLPFRRDPDFVDRPVMNQIFARTSQPGARIGLVGLGGIGKSQIAIEYAYRVRSIDPSTSVFWVHASSAARFGESFQRIATSLRLPESKESKSELLSTVCAWLSDEGNGRWTMIVDNADAADVLFDPWYGEQTSTAISSDRPLAEYLPVALNGSIIIISRSQDVVERLQVHSDDILNINPMNINMAEDLLLTKLKKGKRPSPTESKNLVVRLDCMPLAISQAAAYIDQRTPRVSVSRYLEMLEKNDNDSAALLLKNLQDPRRDREASNSILMTLYVTFTHLQQARYSAARLLALMSVFDREAIPENLLQGRYMKSLNLEADFEDDVATLRAYNLIGISMNGDQFAMHRLVQLSTQKWLEMRNELVNWQEQFIDIVASVFPFGAYANWKTCQALFPHLQVMSTYNVSSESHLKKWSTGLRNGSWYARETGQYGTAEKMIRASLEVRQRLFGLNNEATLDSMNTLAAALRCQGKYSEAEEMGRQTLANVERTLGVDHPKTLTSLSNLALVLQKQYKYSEAEEMNRRTLQSRERILGVDHPDTSTSLSNLAVVLLSQGKHSESEAMNRQALARREKALGADHPDTLNSKSNLARVLRCRGKYSESEELNRQTLASAERILGLDHPNTLTSTVNLVWVLMYMERYSEAEDLCQRTLARIEKVLGMDHPLTLNVVRNLAYLYGCMGMDHDALKLFDRAIESYEKGPRPNHQLGLQCSRVRAALLNRSNKGDETHFRGLLATRSNFEYDARYNTECPSHEDRKRTN